MDGRLLWPLALAAACLLVLAFAFVLVGGRRGARQQRDTVRSTAGKRSGAASRPAADRTAAGSVGNGVVPGTARAAPSAAESENDRVTRLAGEAVMEASRREFDLRSEKRLELERQMLERSGTRLRNVQAPHLVLASEPAAAPQPREAAVVMIADDSKVVRVKTGRLLVQHDYKVSLATDGVDAVHQLRYRVPDVLIIDVDMPGLNGFEVTRMLRGNPETAKLPIIMITSSEARYREEAEQCGVDVLMGKPYSEEEMIEHIRRALQRRSVPMGVAA